MSSRLLLEPGPASVRRARRWVSAALSELGRDDLVDSAALGVSELVTNAILHADPPIIVGMGGTAQHPRIEVHDNSTQPPAINRGMADDDQLLHTVGRGLGIVALYSATWGAEVSPDGKVIWFEPADQPDAGVSSEGSVFDLSEIVESRLVEAPDPGVLTTIRLLAMPVARFADFREWYSEIRRELRLLTLSDQRDHPVARELAALALQVEQERAQADGIDTLDAAIAAGRATVDLEYHVPSSAPATMARIADLLDEVDEFCREHALLTVPATPEQVALRRWYLGEFVRQAAGEPPLPWPGPVTLAQP